jgi:hypothetical protein
MDDMGGNVRLSGMCSNSSHIQLQEYSEQQRRSLPHFKPLPQYDFIGGTQALASMQFE